MTIPTSAIRLSYLWPCNAAQAAANLSWFYQQRISALVVKHRWQEECEIFPLFVDLGERPECGFPRSDAVLLAIRMVAVDHGVKAA